MHLITSHPHYREANGNRIHCDCGVAWMKSYVPLRNAINSPVVCSSPSALRGTRLEAVELSSLECSKLALTRIRNIWFLHWSSQRMWSVCLAYCNCYWGLTHPLTPDHISPHPITSFIVFTYALFSLQLPQLSLRWADLYGCPEVKQMLNWDVLLVATHDPRLSGSSEAKGSLILFTTDFLRMGV